MNRSNKSFSGNRKKFNNFENNKKPKVQRITPVEICKPESSKYELYQNKVVKFNYDTKTLKELVNIVDTDDYVKIITDVLIIRKLIVDKIRSSNTCSVFEYIKHRPTYDDIRETFNYSVDYSQHEIFVEYNDSKKRYVTNKRYKHKLTFNNLVDLNSTEYKDDLPTTYLVKHCYDGNFWLSLYPGSIEPENMTLELVNVLLGLYTETVRATISDFDKKEKTEDEYWKMADDLVNKIVRDFIFKYDQTRKEFVLDVDKSIQRCNFYNTLVELTSCESSFFKRKSVTMKYPINLNKLIPVLADLSETGVHINKHLQMIYKLFLNDRFRYRILLQNLVATFLEDRNQEQIKLKTKSKFSDEDTIVEFSNKIANLILTRSGVKDVKQINSIIPAICKKLNALLDYLESISNESYFVINNIKETLDRIDEINSMEPYQIPNVQLNPLISVAMLIMNEIYYSDKIKIIGNVSEDNYKLYDSLISRCILILRKYKAEMLICNDVYNFYNFYIDEQIYDSNEEFYFHTSNMYANTMMIDKVKDNEDFLFWFEKGKLKLHDYIITKYNDLKF